MTLKHLNPPLTRQQAEAAVRAIETAMDGGAIWPLPRGADGRSALQEAAAVLGITTSSVGKRLQRAHEVYGISPRGLPLPPKAPTPQRKGSAGSKADQPAPVLRDTVRLSDELARLRAELKDRIRAEIDADEVRRVLGSLAAPLANPPRWTIAPTQKGDVPEVPVTIWSDWHIPEVVSRSETNGVNEFNIDIAERRVRRLVETTIYLLKSHGPGRYPGIVINLLGDFISGALHPELAKTDAETEMQSVLRVRDLLIWALDRMLAAFGQVFCPCASGNHARNTQKPEFKRYVFNSFDWLIYELLRRHYATDPRITFLNPDSNEALYRVYNVRYLAMHGDMLGVKGGDGIIGSIGPIMRGSMKVGKQAAAIGRDFDRLLMGHWHQPLMLPGITVANCLKGYDEFAAKALRAPPSVPSQPLWLVHPKWGQTAYREVWLEDPGAAAQAEWVSVRAA